MAKPELIYIPLDEYRFQHVGKLPDGSHLSTDVRFVGLDSEEYDEIMQRSDAMFDALWDEYNLDEAQLQGIFIKPFSITREGILYGLVYSDDEAEFFPFDVVFYPPWDEGLYNT